MLRDTFPPPPPPQQLRSTLSGPPQLAIQTAGGPPIQPTPTETLILRGGQSGMWAGCEVWVMACPQHGAVAAVHMESSSMRERRSGTDSGTGRLYSHDPWAGPGDRWLEVMQHAAGHVSAPPPKHCSCDSLSLALHSWSSRRLEDRPFSPHLPKP